MTAELCKCKKCGEYYDFRLDDHKCKNGESETISAAERLYWFSHLILLGNSAYEAKMILEEAVKKFEAGNA